MCYVLSLTYLKKEKKESRISSQVSRALRTKISNKLSLFFVYYNDCFACVVIGSWRRVPCHRFRHENREILRDNSAEAKLLGGESLL